MKIFISWSGAHSRAIAEALNDWLRRVIQAVKPFYSPEIEKGAKWSSEVDEALEGTRFGIICLTPDNLKSPWIYYEAGALSKTKDALIWTFLSGLTPGDVPPPLGKFQHTVAEKDDVLMLLKTINRRLADAGGESLQERLLEENFELFWPKLEEKLRGAEALSEPVTLEKNGGSDGTGRNERAILDEILELVRSQERRLLDFEVRLTDVQPVTTHPKQQISTKAKAHNVYSVELLITSDRVEDTKELVERAVGFLELLSLDTCISTIKRSSEHIIYVSFIPYATKRYIGELCKTLSDRLKATVQVVSMEA